MQFAAYNDEDIFRDERAWVYQSETEGYGILWFQTDKRKKLILRPMDEVNIARGVIELG